MVDDEIEKAVLHYMIFEQEEFNLSEKDFIDATNKRIIKAINELKAKKEDIDMLSIRNKIDSNSHSLLEYLANIGNNVYGYHPEAMFKKLKSNSKKRELYRMAVEVQKEIEQVEDIDIYIEKIIDRLRKIEAQTENEESFMNLVVQTSEEIEKSINKKEDYSLYTGFFELDEITDGLHRGELTIIGARPGTGKSTIALQIANRIASKNQNVAFISLEMSGIQIVQKMLAKNARVNSRKIRNGDLTEKEFAKVGIECGKISNLPINIYTKIRTIQQIEIQARKLKNKNKLDLLVIDYLQLIKNVGKFNNREQELADISRTLKLLSLELNIPIIALCQLNRNASRNEPTLADIRESGAIEQDADNVIFLYYEDDESNLVTVDLQKQRAGNTGKLRLSFNKVYSEFLNIER